MYENDTRLSTLTLIALPKHEQRENQPKIIFVIPITSHLQNLTYTPARTHSISGLKSRVLKLAFLT